MKTFFRHNGLSLVLVALFLSAFAGQIATGMRDHNNDKRAEGEPPLALAEYLRSGHFLEATAENWESEFLQMAMFVILTAFLFQKGSAESKDPDEDEPVDEEPRLHQGNPAAPFPVRKGGLALRLYSHSLSIAFFLLFFLSFALHAAGGVREYNEERASQGQSPVSTAAYAGSSRFWFESLQNWQSEFLSLACMVVFTIYLREKGSPESKPVFAAHHDGGEKCETELPPPVARPQPAA